MFSFLERGCAGAHFKSQEAVETRWSGSSALPALTAAVLLIAALLIFGPVTAGAKVDPNPNAMSALWESAYSVVGADPLADPDGDGQNNFQESVAGTDPEDSNSVFRLQAIPSPAAAYLVRWNSIAGKRYQVETTSALVGGSWTPVGNIVQGTGGEVLASVPPGNPPFVAMRLKLLVDNFAFQQGRAFLPNVDTDGDGFPDADEWAAGTDPFDAGSRLAIRSIGFGKAATLKWSSVRGKRYQVQSSPTPAGVWSSRGDVLQGDGLELSASVEVSADQQFFRVNVSDGDDDRDGVTDWEEAVAGLDAGPWHYRTNFPTAPALITAIVSATNTISIEPGTAVANATRGTPGSFRVMRSGNLNALTLHYTVSGDAIGGTDYAKLSRSVTLPMGVNEVEIPVVPLSEAGLNPVRSVVVTLNSGAGYVLATNASAQVNVLKEAALSVRDFGAVGDGVTDDTVAIQAAIAALEASPAHNTLHFPPGSYRLNTVKQVSTAVISWNQLLVLGTAELAGRDLLITGEPGAELYSTVSWVRARMLVVNAKFRSLAFRGMSWRKDDVPIADPNEADGVSLMRYDLRRVESVNFQDCTFVNCHGAVAAYNYGYDPRGRLANFIFHGCQVLNPYGSNTRDVTFWGGGQQVSLNQWIGRAVYSENLFDGGTNAPVDPVRNPGGKRKDGSHFGGPLNLIFTHNVVRHMEVEAVYQTDDPVMGVTETSFVVPSPDGATTVTAKLLPEFLTTYRAGQIINFHTPLVPGSTPGDILLTIVSYDAASRMMTLKNEGQTANSAGKTIPASVVLYLQKDDPPLATIENNIIEDEDGSPVGLLGISASAKATIRGNFIRNYLNGVLFYPNLHNILFPPTIGTRIDANVILTANPMDSATTTFGVQTWGPGDILANNLIVTPVSTRFVGVGMRDQDSWAEANTILPGQVIRHAYGDNSNRSVGVGVGDSSKGTTSVANRTSGLDVGIGPINADQIIPHRVISHISTNDTLPIDHRGLLP